MTYYSNILIDAADYNHSVHAVSDSVDVLSSDVLTENVSAYDDPVGLPVSEPNHSFHFDATLYIDGTLFRDNGVTESTSITIMAIVEADSDSETFISEVLMNFLSNL